MAEHNTASLSELLQFALPIGTTLLSGSPDAEINWAITVRARPPAFPDIYGGEFALVSMELLHGYDSRMKLVDVVDSLAKVNVGAIAVLDTISDSTAAILAEMAVPLLALPEGSNLTSVERAINKFIVNQPGQRNDRVMEVQRQLTRQAAENRDLNSILQVIARATARTTVVHNESGTLVAQVHPNVVRRDSRSTGQSVPYGAFQNWLERNAAEIDESVVTSPIGYTTILKVEKRMAGYLSLIDDRNKLDEFTRLVMLAGADVCAIELAKTRAIAFAVEQVRGDWIQMWLSGTPADDEMLITRAKQVGFEPDATYAVAAFRAHSGNSSSIPLESLASLVRDDMVRRHINGAVGLYVDVIVALYPLEDSMPVARIGIVVEGIREQLAQRLPGGAAAGISRPVRGLVALRDAYSEARDAMSIASELGDGETTTFYGDLKLFQFLLAVRKRNLTDLRDFYVETLDPLVEYDERKQADLIRTLSGFFDANGNLAKAAQDLDVHRNTLVYRLERISELTGMNLDDADNRLILHLALKIQRVLATLVQPT